MIILMNKWLYGSMFSQLQHKNRCMTVIMPEVESQKQGNYVILSIVESVLL